jgi:predicted NodU family carbamoyl transferase
VEESLTARGVAHVRVPDRVDAALRAGKAVGWFQGRMKYGPRALCRRSIPFHTRDPKANDWLNQRMSRTEFMPFAPVTTRELAGRYSSEEPRRIRGP